MCRGLIWCFLSLPQKVQPCCGLRTLPIVGFQVETTISPVKGVFTLCG